MASKSGDCICGGIIAFVVGVGMIYYGAKRYLLYQEVRNTPTSKVESAAVGLVELFGKAKCQTDMSSPVSGVKSIYYKVVGEYYKSGKHGGWRTIYTHISSSQFYLEDETGKMLIDPKFAEVDIPSDFKTEGHLTDKGFLGLSQTKLDDKALAFINKNPDVKAKFDGYSSSDLRITEYFIAEGDPLYVLGRAEPKEGATSDIAYENLIIKNGTNDIKLYISDSGEKKVIDNMKSNIIFSLVGGLVLAVVGLLVTLLMLGSPA